MVMKSVSVFRIPPVAALALVALLGACAHKSAPPQLGAAQADKFLFDRGSENLKNR